MSEHVVIYEGMAHEFEGAIHLKEIQCGGKYVVAGQSADFCPNCGEPL